MLLNENLFTGDWPLITVNFKKRNLTLKHTDFHNSIASFEAERAGVFVRFGTTLDFEHYYTAYQKHCKQKKLTPVSEQEFMPVSNRLISELREWWYTKEIGIYVVESIEIPS